MLKKFHLLLVKGIKYIVEDFRDMVSSPVIVLFRSKHVFLGWVGEPFTRKGLRLWLWSKEFWLFKWPRSKSKNFIMPIINQIDIDNYSWPSLQGECTYCHSNKNAGMVLPFSIKDYQDCFEHGFCSWKCLSDSIHGYDS